MGNVIAIYGALTGTIALLIHYFTYLRDRADIHITIQRKRRIINTPQYDPNKLYTCINVANRGRRTVIITKVAYIYMTKRGGAILSDSMIYGSRELGEGKSADLLMEDDDKEFRQIAYFSAFDATGKEYRKYISPFYTRFWYILLDLTGIKRKPWVSPEHKRKENPR